MPEPERNFELERRELTEEIKESLDLFWFLTSEASARESLIEATRKVWEEDFNYVDDKFDRAANEDREAGISPSARAESHLADLDATQSQKASELSETLSKLSGCLITYAVNFSSIRKNFESEIKYVRGSKVAINFGLPEEAEWEVSLDVVNAPPSSEDLDPDLPDEYRDHQPLQFVEDLRVVALADEPVPRE